MPTPLFKTTLPFGSDQTYWAKGPNFINADAVVVEWWPETEREPGCVKLAARVQSTQGEHHAWLTLPADPEYLRALAAHLEWISEQPEVNEEETSQ